MKIVTNLFCLFLLTTTFFACSAKHAEFGNWTTRLPEDQNYFYAVGGPSQLRSEANAHARSEMAKFIRVTVDSEIERIIEGRNEEVDKKTLEQLRIKANETLRYVNIVEVHKSPEGYYALARMPCRPLDELIEKIKFVKIPPSWDEIARSAVVPGWGQFQKRQFKKGVVFLSSEALLIGGYLIFDSFRDDAHEKSIFARTAGARKDYQDREQNYERLVLGTMVGIGAIYVANLVDAWAVPKTVEVEGKSASIRIKDSAAVICYQW